MTAILFRPQCVNAAICNDRQVDLLICLKIDDSSDDLDLLHNLRVKVKRIYDAYSNLFGHMSYVLAA